MATCARYVKFLRGTPQAFAALPHKEEDTLYFICEEDEEVGQLWIGNRLITQSTDDDSVLNYLNELKDVDTSGAKQDQYLGYDAKQQKWIPMTPEQAISASIMMGATNTYAGQSGLVPAPAAGDNKKFLRGDGEWVKVEMPEEQMAEIQTQINSKASTTDLNDVKFNLFNVNTKVINIESTLNNFMSNTEDKLTTIENDIVKLKNSTTWQKF